MIRLGVSDPFLLQPILYAVGSGQIDHQISLIIQPDEENLTALHQKRLDGAFLSPLAFADHHGDLQLVKDVAVITTGPGRYASLFFRENLQRIETAATFSRQRQYQTLANLVLNEFYEMAVDWQPVEKKMSLEATLDVYPACFYSGLASVQQSVIHDNRIDVLDEWTDKTGIPYIHQLLAVHENRGRSGVQRRLGSRNLRLDRAARSDASTRLVRRHRRRTDRL